MKQFNLQTQRVRIAARTDETAQRRNEVARKLYILGKSTILVTLKIIKCHATECVIQTPIVV